MMKFKALALAAAASVAIATPAAAVEIVNTGPGPAGLGWDLSPDQSLGAEFTIGQAYVISSLEGWIYTQEPSTILFSIYSDGGDVPGTELFSDSINIGGAQSVSWLGTFGQSWALGPGTYWAVFGMTSGDGGMTEPSSSPLTNEAFFNGSWNGYDDLELGVRINAVETAVPEPGTWAMMLMGFGAIGLSFKRRHKFAIA